MRLLLPLITLIIFFMLLIPVSAQETYRGIVFKANAENLAGIINDLRLAGIDIGLDEAQKSLLARYGSKLPVAGIMLTKNDLFILVSNKTLETGYYEVHGGTLPPILVSTTLWTPLKVFEYQRLPAEEVTIADLKSHPERYLFKEIKLTATLTEFSFTFDYEGVLIPISVGVLSDVEPDPEKFTAELVGVTKDVLANPSWDKVVEVAGKYAGIPAFRIQEGYWKNARAEITGFVTTPEALNAWIGITLLDPSNFDVLLPAGKALVFLNEVKLVSERAEVPDILGNPSSYSHKVVEIETMGMGTDISVRRLLEIASIPTLVGPAAQEFVQRVNVLLEGEVVWKPVTPDIDNLLYISGTRSYSKRPVDTLIIPISELDGRFIVKGVVTSASNLDPALPNVPMLIAFEKRKVGNVSPMEISSDVKKKILEKLKKIEVVFTGNITDKENVAEEQPKAKSTEEITKPTESKQTPLSERPIPSKTPESIMTSTPVAESATRKTPGFGVIAVVVAGFGALALTRIMRRR